MQSFALHLPSSDIKFQRFRPKLSSLAVDFPRTRSIAVQAVYLQVSFAVVLNHCSRDKGHQGDGQELSQRPPRENVIQRRDLGQDWARPNTDEVVGDQTWKHRAACEGSESGLHLCFRTVFGSSPINTEKKKMEMGMLRTGQVMLRNQLGVMGKKRRKRRRKNKLLRFSSTWQRRWKRSKGVVGGRRV